MRDNKMTLLLLEAVRDKIEESINYPCSDYLLAENLGVRKQTVAKWLTKGQIPETYVAIRIAHILKEPELKIIALLEQDRAKDEGQKQIWSEVLKKTFRNRRKDSGFLHFA